MTRLRDRRLDRIAAAKVTNVPVPSILRVGMFETQAEARARFAAAWPNRKPGHAVLCVPAKPATPEEKALYETRLFENQTRLVAEARHERVTATTDTSAAPIAARRWPTSPVIRPNGPHVTWRPN